MNNEDGGRASARIDESAPAPTAAHTLWIVERVIHTGHSQPISIPGFPSLPAYRFDAESDPLPYEEAKALQREMPASNPGVPFTLTKATGEEPAK